MLVKVVRSPEGKPVEGISKLPQVGDMFDDERVISVAQIDVRMYHMSTEAGLYQLKIVNRRG